MISGNFIIFREIQKTITNFYMKVDLHKYMSRRLEQDIDSEKAADPAFNPPVKFTWGTISGRYVTGLLYKTLTIVCTGWWTCMP